MIGQKDEVLRFVDCIVKAYGLTQTGGDVDHSLTIIDSTFDIKDWLVYASKSNYGDGIRIYNSVGTIENMTVRRKPGGKMVLPPTYHNAAVSIISSSLDNTAPTRVSIKHCDFEGLQGLYLTNIFGERDMNRVTVENTRFCCDLQDVVIAGSVEEEIDLGGGGLGSRGNNTFSGTNIFILLTNTTQEVAAYSNHWDALNPRARILDFSKDPRLGRVNMEYTSRGISHTWLARHGFATNDAAEELDTDRDCANNLREYSADTSPTNRDSVFVIGGIAGPTLNVHPCSTARTYRVDTTDGASGAWQEVTNFRGTGSNMVIGLPAVNPPQFYRASGSGL